MKHNIYNKIFLTVALLATVVNNYAKTTAAFHDSSNVNYNQEAYSAHSTNVVHDDEVAFFKSLLAVEKNLFFAEEITIEDFEEYKKQVFYLKKKSLFGSNSNAILYKIVFESAYSKVLEETQHQKTLAKNTGLNLHKKFEVYLI